MRTRKTCAAVLILLAALPVVFLAATQLAVTKYEGLHRGDRLPRARLQTSGNLWIDTDSWRGSPMLLVVVHPGCAPCKKEVEGLSAIAHVLPDLKIVLLSTGTEIAGMQTPFPLFADPEGGFLRRVRRLVTPALYWVNAAGEIRYARIGQRPAGEEQKLLLTLMEQEGKR